MKKNVWIFNHYATNMFFDKAGRHYWFAENLINRGYNPVIFCASTNHFSNKQIGIKKGKYITKVVNNITFVFVKVNIYKGNGIKRIFNIFLFYKRIFSVAKKYAKLNCKPDIILASSVHPLTLVAGIKISNKFKVSCICEIRDLWPESIVAYGILRRKSIIAKLLYAIEKRIYVKSDYIIMTWAGGRRYIKDQGWDNKIDLNKIVYISNGVVLSSFDKNEKENTIDDLDLVDKKFKNLIYAGTIGKVNNLGILIDCAKKIEIIDKKIRFLIYGSGVERKRLQKRCEKEDINNVIFKGRIEKKEIPFVLSNAYANILHNSSTSLNKYGQSQNKFFEYLAAGKCIIQTYNTGYSILEKYNCGVSASRQNVESIIKIIFDVCSNVEKANQKGENARKAAYDFDFTNLTKKLIEIIEKD